MSIVPIQLDEGATVPRKAHPTEDAGFDLVARERAVLFPGTTVAVSTGVRVAIPEGHVGLVCSRSGMALHSNVVVANAPGIIDPGYRGEVKVILHKLPGERPWADSGVTIHPGHKIAQLVIVATTPVTFASASELLSGSERGEKGFGSTGR